MRPRAHFARGFAMTGMMMLALGSTGCLNGVIYRNTTLPLDTDFDHTPVHDGRRGESWKSLVIPIFYQGGQVRIDWGDMSIAKALEEAGIETVYYADIETRSILGIWTERWVHVYGE